MELDTTFYVLGGVLVALALVISFIGVRGKDKFPPSKAAMAGGLLVVGAVVVATAGYAVALAREEKEHREHEQAAEEGHAEEEVAGKKAPAGEELAVSSPEDGSLSFDPPELKAATGEITLAYENPSLITHNIYLQDEEDTVIAESDDVAEGTVEIQATLVPGEYIYFCNIPGHRDGGMEGVLTVE
jgi:plastocyanin